MLKEFKAFAMRGNVLDMAIGIILGGAFGKIVSSFVNDVMMPPLGRLMGNVDFSNLFVSLTGQSFATLKEARDKGAATLNYGVFVNTLIDFVLVALAVFLLVKAVNRMRKPEAAAAPTTKSCPFCCMAIPIPASRCAHCTAALAR